jgi:Ser/Thr protein kinase RdoA (MazF antagonist)
MRGESACMSWSLSDETLREALQAWPLPAPPVVKRLASGFTSEVWLVEAGDERFVAKYAHQPQAAFEGGLYAAECAERHGISSGAPLRTRDGDLSFLVPGPHGACQPLALLRFVPGEPLLFSEPEAPTLYGHLLGWTHRLFLDEGIGPAVAEDVYAFLQKEEDYVAAQPGLAPLIQQAVEATRAYEQRGKATYGVIWADRMEIRRDQQSGRIGIIDWGAIEGGPLLFDVALSLLWIFPEGSQAANAFLRAYLAVAPMKAGELEALDAYKALVWARQAKFFAYRIAARDTLGGSTQQGNMESFAQARQELERFLERGFKRDCSDDS